MSAEHRRAAAIPDLPTLMTETHAYYEALAEHYHLGVADWPGAIHRHGSSMAALIGRFGAGGNRVLDVTCGIGTQTLGLALHGYEVTGVDISATAIDRARREAAALGIDATFRVGDMRSVGSDMSRSFDAVICCDNSLPHLLTMPDLFAGLKSMLCAARPGGVVLTTIRDYDRHVTARPTATIPETASDRVVFQQWQWLDDSVYQAKLFILTRRECGTWSAEVHAGATFRAWRRAEITAVVDELGAEAKWLSPKEAGYHQHTLVVHA